MFARLGRTIPRSIVQTRKASSKAAEVTTTTEGVGIWERQKLYGRTPSTLSDPMHGSGRVGEKTGGEIAGMSVFIASFAATLVAGVVLMESQRKAAEE